MIDIGSIQAAIGSLKTAGDIAKGLMDLKTTTEIQSKVIELQREILSAQSSAISAQDAQSALLQEKRALEAKMAEMEAWEDEAKRYELTSYGGQTFAYALKEGMEKGEPFHSICPTCYQKRTKSILQLHGTDAFGRKKMYCPVCQKMYPLGTPQARDFPF
jgi:formate dehydrogenase maturation protein FdhE